MSTLRLLLFASLLLASGQAHAVRRVALLVGANVGLPEDTPLRYASADARRVAATLREVGQFSSSDLFLLDQAPTPDQVLGQLASVRQLLEQSSGQTLFVFYYSGHADAQALHLQGQRLLFSELYRQVKELPATVKVGILDACSSGAILGVKGGQRVNWSGARGREELKDRLAVNGTVFLTSSGADELSQEVKDVSGSIFSHHLVSGLRGAADADGDRQVSLDEVYHYASTHTWMDTALTPAGAQRPARGYELKGQGQIYLSSLQGKDSAFLQFKSQQRHCFITDEAESRILAEVVASPDKCLRVAVPAGTHVLKCFSDTGYQMATFRAPRGARVEVDRLTFREVPRRKDVFSTLRSLWPGR